jgi:hypothetical protein
VGRDFSGNPRTAVLMFESSTAGVGEDREGGLDCSGSVLEPTGVMFSFGLMTEVGAADGRGG